MLEHLASVLVGVLIGFYLAWKARRDMPPAPEPPLHKPYDFDAYNPSPPES